MASYPKVSLLRCGFLSPPATKFLADAKDGDKLTMPSMAFLIHHPASDSKIVFDLSIRKDLTKYHPGLQKHLQTRHPLSSENDVKSALARGGLAASDVDFVIMSHVHWDHVGTPSDFPNATFIAGPLTGKLLRNELGADLYNPFFEADLLPVERTVELPGTPTPTPTPTITSTDERGPVFDSKHGWYWQKIPPIANAIDMFNDGTIYIVDAPGHVPGHLNALVRIRHDQWVYLAADSCHHPRIFSGETDFGSWKDERGRMATIHKDLEAARRTLNVMRTLEKDGFRGTSVEVVLAHDGDWEKNHIHNSFPRHL